VQFWRIDGFLYSCQLHFRVREDEVIAISGAKKSRHLDDLLAIESRRQAA
jgi:hypothetical protein